MQERGTLVDEVPHEGRQGGWTQGGASRGQQEDAKSDRGTVCPSEDMNEVPLGARRQHASPHASSEPTRIKRLQKQLDESRRIEVEHPKTGSATGQATMGLPDSCATHALRHHPRAGGKKAIVPMSQLVGDGGTLVWSAITREANSISRLCGGCLVVDRKLVLELIDELGGSPRLAKAQVEADPMGDYSTWLRRLVGEHSGLHGVPEAIIQRL